MTRYYRFVTMLGVAGVMTATAACGGDTEESAEPPAADGAVVAPAAPPAVGAEIAFLDPNEATREQLLSVPNLDAVAADAIIAERPHADMRTVDAILAARLSEEQRDSVFTRLWKPLDLNSATGEEILLIPGVGERMEHEFMEYRPYPAIEEFRREIGKYVDEEEVARLERYVTVR